MASEETEWEDSMPIPYQPCGSILTTMGFLPERMPQESNDFRLFSDLWALTDGEKTGGVSVDNLLYLLLIIRGAKLPEREREFEPDTNRNTKLLKLVMVDEESNMLI